MNPYSAVLEPVREELHDLSRYIYTHPEEGYQETEASGALCAFLEKHGFSVERGAGGLPTAFRAVSGTEGPAFCYLSEYDALPMGHACGHNLIAVSGAAMFYAASMYAEENRIPGRFVLTGTPAEEVYGGKIEMAKKGMFDDCGAAFILHPYAGTHTDPGWLSAVKLEVSFHGRAAHAGSCPEYGLNALDAVVMVYQAVSLWRQQLPEPSRVHGIITNGGSSPNIIPDYTSGFWYLRAQDPQTSNEMRMRFEAIVHAAAEATGTRSEIRMISEYPPSLFNGPLNRAWTEGWRTFYGEDVVMGNGTEGRASSDFAVVSRQIPGANCLFDITGGAAHPLHTAEFMADACTDYGFDQTMKAASIGASIGIRYLSDEAFRSEVNSSFLRK